MSIKAFKYRLSATPLITERLQWVLDRCRELYNAGLQERRDVYELAVKRHPNYYDNEIRKHLIKVHAVGYYEQKRELVNIKALRTEYQEIASQVLQDVMLRLQRAFEGFFRRVLNGDHPGYPRFQGCTRYDSFMYPSGEGWKLDSRERPADKQSMVKVKLHLSKIGTVQMYLHRSIEGTIKTLTIKREGDHWYAIFTCDIGKPDSLPMSYEDVGIDLGVTHFAALSTGEFIEHPHYFRKAEKQLAKAQQSLSRKQRGSHRRTKAVKRVAKCHRKIRNQRKDFHHKASHKLVNYYQVIVFEDLQVKNLTKAPAPKQNENGKYLPNGAAAKAGLNKSILDAGWSTFTQTMSVKAAWAGRTIIFVDPSMTSQLCSGCGAVVKKDLSERWHSCECGTELDRDTNAAINILNKGKKQLSGGARPTSATT